jgi:hypothetical protein
MLIVEIWLKGIGCKADQGPATIVMIFVEIPIVVLTCYYGKQFKNILTQQSKSHHTLGESPTFVTKHLLEQEDRYVTLKKLQANLAIIVQIVSFCLHIVDIVLYYGGDGQKLCNENDELNIKDGIALAIRWIQNVAELFPHFMIPLIFWYLPAKMATQYSTLYVLIRQHRYLSIARTVLNSTVIELRTRRNSQNFRWETTKNHNSSKVCTMKTTFVRN